MRKVNTLGVSLVGAIGAVIAIACGGTSTSNNPPGAADAGQDATSSNNNVIDGGDASQGDDATGDDAAACFIDADILTLAPADASIDDAGDSVGTCLGCMQTSCASSLTTCNGDCMCNQGFTCLANCIGGVGNSLLSCLGICFPGGLTAIEGEPAELGVVTCAYQSCQTQCGATGLLGGKKDGGGGGKKDGGDAGDDDGGSDLDGASE